MTRNLRQHSSKYLYLYIIYYAITYNLIMYNLYNYYNVAAFAAQRWFQLTDLHVTKMIL